MLITVQHFLVIYVGVICTSSLSRHKPIIKEITKVIRRSRFRDFTPYFFSDMKVLYSFMSRFIIIYRPTRGCGNVLGPTKEPEHGNI